MLEEQKPEPVPITIICPIAESTPEPSELPDWMKRIVRRQCKIQKLIQHNEEKSFSQIAHIWNDFLAEIDLVNDEFGTNYTSEKIWLMFQGQDAPIEDEFDEDDDD